jgi:predicted ThiF/HesA family dinucleotide-utilizing enzyme
MDRHAADALVRGWQRFLPRLAGTRIDPKDRHVVAAALKARADRGDEGEVAIVTSDVRGFPARELQALGLVRSDPDAFALALFEQDADRVLVALGKMRAALTRPPFTRDRFVDELIAAHFPALARAVGPFRTRF